MRIKISPNGPELSKIIAGVWKWGSWGANLSIKNEGYLISACIDQGITSFDHADIYGDFLEEERFGNAFKDVSAPKERILN